MALTYIGMGGNQASAAGDPAATLAAAAEALAQLGRIAARSSLYSTEPVGYADQPRFVNAVVALDTELAPRALLAELQRIEQKFGRRRVAGLRNGPRTLDLDLLLYDAAILDEPDLEVPHPRLHERAFVLVPLAEIAPALVEPRSGRMVATLLAGLHAEADAVVPLVSTLWCARAPREEARS